jgi:hypothetical protein
MFELTTQELQEVAGGIIAANWIDGEYFVRYDDGSVQKFSENDGVTFYK